MKTGSRRKHLLSFFQIPFLEDRNPTYQFMPGERLRFLDLFKECALSPVHRVEDREKEILIFGSDLQVPIQQTFLEEPLAGFLPSFLRDTYCPLFDRDADHQQIVS